MSLIQQSYTNISVQPVKGGFVVQISDEKGYTTEVFTSKGKVMKAIRTFIEDNSLVGGKEEATDAE